MVSPNRALLYATGGVAFAEYNTSDEFTGNINGVRTINRGNVFGGGGGFRDSRVGWTVGGGLAYALTPNWSVFGEYRYSDFGTVSKSALFAGIFGVPGLAGGVVNVNRQLTENQVQIGFSYKFDVLPPPPPLVAKY
ncbi:MAG TPA: outer membrane beta-barrel protein [Methylocella sp.]|nr:outer membrane beta-barrel protein [Methylocella sp.]